MSNTELLAPAGNYDCFQTAVRAGADAVYLGGTKFGARAFADNFSEQELLRALEYGHIHEKKLYLTVNTLLKEDELTELYSYMKPLYEAGLDAVIVQDLGVASFLHREFPDLILHASTQMTVCNSCASGQLQKLGITRIVPARELSLQELVTLKKNTGMELEVFIHGALCYCYSGQCLLSSMIGGRSGNRGACAQPCRLPYEAYEQGKRISNANKKYLLSPKDLESVGHLQKLIDARIDSFKIEGRMKSREYVANVVSIYRDVIDGIGEVKTHKENLMEVFNRGGFTSGYALSHNGPAMMSMEQTGHAGIIIGEIKKIQRDSIWITLTKDIHKLDGIDIRISQTDTVSLTANVDGIAGETIVLRGKGLKKLRTGMKVFRMKSQQVVEFADKGLPKLKREISMKAEFRLGEKAKLTIYTKSCTVAVYGDVIDAAQNRPVTKDELRKNLSKMGDSEYEIVQLDIMCDKNIFLPVRSINDLRRKGLEVLTEEIIALSKRTIENSSEKSHKEATKKQDMSDTMVFGRVHVSVQTMEQLQEVLKNAQVYRITVQTEWLSKQDLLEAMTVIRKAGKQAYIQMPFVFTHQIETMWKQKMEGIKPDGFVVKTYDELCYLLDSRIYQECGLLLDASVYEYNNEAIRYYEGLDARIHGTYPEELHVQDLMKLKMREPELIVYGYRPLMCSAQCVNCNVKGCDHRSHIIELKDRYRSSFYVKNSCDYCYTCIYNGVALCLDHSWKELKQLRCDSLRLAFTIEDAKTTRDVLEQYVMGLEQERDHVVSAQGTYTNGHFRRGL